MAEVFIRSTMVPPPGGKFFFEHDGERIEARYWLEMEPRMEDLMRRHMLKGTPERLVAEYMCPQMPDWYCSGKIAGARPVRVSEARENSIPFFRRNTVTFDELSRRLQICSRCPRHKRNFCITCSGIADWVQSGFGGRRTRVPEDKLSGTCECAKAFEAVIAAVEYGDGEPLWDDVPDTCWRNVR